MSRILNILIRTSGRKNYFSECVRSIKTQTNNKWNIIVGNDTRGENYFKEFDFVRYTKKKIDTSKHIHRYKHTDTLKHFPFNQYLNKMYKRVKDGFVMFLDDDDHFIDNEAVDKILKHATQTRAVFWRVNCDGRLVPSNENWGGRPIERDFSMIGMCFHSRWIPLLQFDEYKRGDYRIADRIYSLMDVHWLDETLTATQDIQHSGQIIDKETENVKVVIFVPVYKRPEITKKHIEGMRRVKKVEGIDVEYWYLLSKEDDKYFDENYDIISNFTDNVISFKNYPVGEKMNIGIHYIYTHVEFDYLMNLGSDDILNPDIFSIYKPYIDNRIRYFGTDTFYCYEKRKCLKFQYDQMIGGARMIHKSILNQMLHKIDLYPDSSNSGLDTASNERIYKIVGTKGLIIESEPLVLDLKSDTNINCMEIVERTSFAEKVSYSSIKKYFYGK